MVAQAGAAALGDMVPVSRTTELAASWYAYNPVQPWTGSNSDISTHFGDYSNSITSGSGAASQTSYLLNGGAFAQVSASGSDNHSPMQHATSQGASTFTYVFQLTAPANLHISGSVSRPDVFSLVGYGRIQLFDDTTGGLLYQAVGAASLNLTTPIEDTYAAAPGRYRFVVSAINQGSGGGPGVVTSAAQALLTIPSPVPTSLATLGALAAIRRRRT